MRIIVNLKDESKLKAEEVAQWIEDGLVDEAEVKIDDLYEEGRSSSNC